MPKNPLTNIEWIEDCMKWRRSILIGEFSHWCNGWDGIPIDETCDEWPCECAADLQKEKDSI